MNQRPYKQEKDRQQSFLLPPSIEEYVGEDNPVRAIDSYVESLDLKSLGFKNTDDKVTPGQPAFNPKELLKLYLYGYLHRVRSSRRLEAECQRNLEVMWLMGGLRPGYKTIADFRKDNLKALKMVNHDFVQLCKEVNLFGAELVGIDGSFFRGNVAKGRIFTKDRLKRALAYVEKDIDPFGLVEQGQGGFQIACGLSQLGLGHMPAVQPIHQGGLQTQLGGSFQVMSGEGVISPLTVDHGQAEMMVGSDVFSLRAVLGGQL